MDLPASDFVINVIGLALAAIVFFVSLRQFKLSKTMEYMQHLSDPGMIETRCAVDITG